MRTKDKRAGFTLVEFGVIMIIGGLLFTGIMHVYRLYDVNRIKYENIDRMDRLMSAIILYQGTKGYYPCPAPPKYSPDDAGFGEMDCSMKGAVGFSCDATTGICRVPSMRDTNNDGSVNSDDAVLIGAVPFKTVSLTTDANFNVMDGNFKEAMDLSIQNAITIQDMYDPHFNQYTFAVTEELTGLSTYNADKGGVQIETEYGAPLLKTDGSAHFVLFSHGRNGRGAYNPGGTINYPCDDPILGNTVDDDNCDYLASPTNVDASNFVIGLAALGETPNYYDDLVYYNFSKTSSLWAQVGENLYNRNLGFVGVNVADPQDMLHVGGNMLADDVHARYYCDTPTGANCMEPYQIGGSGMKCTNPDEVMVGVANNILTCVPANILGAVNPGGCTGSGSYVQGVDKDGNVVCGTL